MKRFRKNLCDLEGRTPVVWEVWILGSCHRSNWESLEMRNQKLGWNLALCGFTRPRGDSDTHQGHKEVSLDTFKGDQWRNSGIVVLYLSRKQGGHEDVETLSRNLEHRWWVHFGGGERRRVIKFSFGHIEFVLPGLMSASWKWNIGRTVEKQICESPAWK